MIVRLILVEVFNCAYKVSEDVKQELFSDMTDFALHF